MSIPDPGRLAIDGELTVVNVAERWRELQPRAADLRVLDLAAVAKIDSAGVALVQALRRLAKAAHGTWPEVCHLPPRMQQLCVAHRVELDRH
jgi:phospholipid transport system transporter-binding protein